MVANPHAAIHWGATILLKNHLSNLRDSPNVEIFTPNIKVAYIGSKKTTGQSILEKSCCSWEHIRILGNMLREEINLIICDGKILRT